MSIDHSQYDDLLALPFVRGARAGSGGIDCLGVTLEMARRRLGPVLLDPWDRVSHLHLTGQPVDHLFSPGWTRVVDGNPKDDDVVLLHSDAELAAGYVLGGLLYGASVRHGVYRADLSRFTVQQVWRYAP